MVRSPFIFSFARSPATFILLALTLALRLPAADTEYDVVIYGGNAAGSVAALQVSRMGGSVVLLEPGPALGGLTTGGLGATDVGDPNAVGGIAHEFYRKIHTYYSDPSAWRSETRAAYGPRHPLAVSDATKLHWFFEPHVATKILHELLAEARVPYHLNAQLDRTRGVHRDGTRIIAITLLDGRTFRGRTFIDTTYEGDLMAAAGVSYIVGREANRRYNETLNGIHFHPLERTPTVDPFVRPGDRTSGLLPRVAPRAPGAAGEADTGMQAYNFRVCLTDVAENRVPFVRPETYDALNYEITLRSIAGLTVRPGPQLFTLTPMPNRKTDTNNRGLFSTDYVGRSHGWAEASYAEREALWQEHKEYTQGFFWFLANDPRVPETVRREVGRWGLARDEFTDTEHWPFQLYVREARRMLGEYVVTEHDCRRKTTVADPVAHASYAMDSHVVGHYVDEQGRLRVEGTFLENIRAFPISYRALLPQRTECTNLIVPVCLSTSHVAYGSARMEPVFMMLGQSAATAAMLAQQQRTTLHDLRYEDLRTRLLADGQVLTIPVRPRSGPPGVRGETPADAVAAIEKLHRLDFFAAAEASTNFWRNAARPGATCEAERIAALIIAAAQRFERGTTRVEDAITVLKKRDRTLDQTAWLTHTQPGGACPGEAVAVILKTLADTF
jgi:hypothetical protein